MIQPVKSLWASVQGDPVFMCRVNGWLTIFWIVMIPISIITGWISSVTYVAALVDLGVGRWALVNLAGRQSRSRTAKGTRRARATPC